MRPGSGAHAARRCRCREDLALRSPLARTGGSSARDRGAREAERSHGPGSHPEVARPPKVTPGRPGGPAARRYVRSGAGSAPPPRITDPAPSRSARPAPSTYIRRAGWEQGMGKIVKRAVARSVVIDQCEPGEVVLLP